MLYVISTTDIKRQLWRLFQSDRYKVIRPLGSSLYRRETLTIRGIDVKVSDINRRLHPEELSKAYQYSDELDDEEGTAFN
jgi:hypothetical protein